MEDRQKWMYEARKKGRLGEYMKGVEEFMKVAVEDMRNNGENELLCPCVDCNNLKKHPVQDVQEHLIRRGFKRKYTNWYWHGEDIASVKASSVPVSGINVNVDENVPVLGINENNNVIVDENVELDDQDSENVNDINVDDNVELDDLMQDVEAEFIDEIPKFFENMCADSKKPLYPNCTKFTKLSAVFKLFSLKAKNGWSDKSFTSLLVLLGEMLPKDNELPVSTYQARKMLCPLKMEVERIHACPNDCILYWKENANLEQCPTCNRSRYKPNSEDRSMQKRPAAKILFYLPIIPRIRRLFANPNDAKLLRWHYDERKQDGQLRCPVDSPEWINFDRKFPDFASEPRNLRLGLCTDGMNPYGTFSSQNTTWPVFLVLYNLASWLCMKRKYLMMPLLISGPKQPGNDIDVYLRPLIDDLKKLWTKGVEVYDAYKGEFFTLRAMLFCTINDFPAYGNLSGHKVKGEKACPVCGSDTCTTRLPCSKKNVYLGHRRFLPEGHPYRNKKKDFNGQKEDREPPIPLSGREAKRQAKAFKGKVQFGKTVKEKSDKAECLKKYSIFWELPYWHHLEVRHCLDAMHIVKGVAENLLGFLNVHGKTRDTKASRDDMVKMRIRTNLAPEPRGDRHFLPPARYTLSKAEKTSMLRCLKSIKVPSGYSANISAKVQMNDLKLIGLKSHDCHVLMTQLLPVAIRGIMTTPIRRTITKLCFFYNSICSKVIDPETLPRLQNDLVETMCELEMYFPPSFFDIMVHVTVHLVREISLCGPVFLRYMYPFERAMGVMKRMVKSRSRPEGNIVETYVAEEIIEFVSHYVEGVEPVGLPRSRHEDRLQGTGIIGAKPIFAKFDLREKAHNKVLQSSTAVAPFIAEHKAELRLQNPTEDENWIKDKHELEFASWLERRVISTDIGVSETVTILAGRPEARVYTFQGYDMNGFTWYTKKQDNKSINQNSGVTLMCMSANENLLDSYYGWVEEIWELDYVSFRVAVFKCQWINNEKKGAIRRDKDGFIIVDPNEIGWRHDPFIMASQAKQVCIQ